MNAKALVAFLEGPVGVVYSRGDDFGAFVVGGFSHKTEVAGVKGSKLPTPPCLRSFRRSHLPNATIFGAESQRRMIWPGPVDLSVPFFPPAPP